MTDYVQTTTDARGVSTLHLNRPDKHNAFDDTVISQLQTALDQLVNDAQTRVLCVTAAGRSFSAGADLAWMKRSANYTHAENQRDAQLLAHMLHTLNTFPAVTVAAVQGAAFGGGTGLVACCDIAIAARSARFALSEVKLGLVPGTISPYVLAAMGERQARRYFLSAEQFDAAEAMRIGLVHNTVDDETLNDTLNSLVTQLLNASPAAQRHTKTMIASFAGRPVTDDIRKASATHIADARASTDGREGIAAFLEKRQAAWVSATKTAHQPEGSPPSSDTRTP